MLPFILLVVFSVISIIAIKWWQQNYAQRKANNFAMLAQQTGWRVEENGRQVLYNRLSHFVIFQRGSEKDIQSILMGQSAGIDFRLISFRHGSMTSIPTEYLILLIENKQINLPAAAFRHKKAGFFFKNGITPPEFEAYPPLKKNYALQTNAPAEVRRLLRPSLLETFALAVQNSHLLEIETAAAQFLCYQHIKGEGIIQTETVQQFVQQGIQIYRHMIGDS